MESDSNALSPQPNSPVNRIAGRCYLGAIGLFLTLLGALFVGLMLRSYLRAKEMRSWPEVSCVILISELEQRRHDENSALEYRQKINFGYEWKGQRCIGDRLSLRPNPWSSKLELMESRLAAYPVGKKTSCWIDPSAQEFAVLQLDSLAPLYSVWFPALFLIAGLKITYTAVRGPKTSTSPLSQTHE